MGGTLGEGWRAGWGVGEESHPSIFPFMLPLLLHCVFPPPYSYNGYRHYYTAGRYETAALRLTSPQHASGSSTFKSAHFEENPNMFSLRQ